MKIMLLSLPREGEALDFTTRDYLLADFSKYPPLGLMAIGTGVDRDRHRVVLYDAAAKHATIDETVRRVEAEAPDVLGISVVTRRLWTAREVARRAKRALPGLRVVAGGPHVNYWPGETLAYPEMDFCLPGYAEETFPALVLALERGGGYESVPALHWRDGGAPRANAEPRITLRTLDHLPFPDRTLVDLDDYYTAVDKARMTTTYSSRGCPFRCTFCDVQEKSYLYRGAQHLADEFEMLKGVGIKEIHVFDDVFNIRRQRVLDICDEVIRRKIDVRWSVRARVNPWDATMLERLKAAGCQRLHVGVESLDPATLEYMNKKQTLADIHAFFAECHRIGLETLVYLIIGFPTETRAYRERLYDAVMKLRPTYAFVNILFPLAKTAYYESLLRDRIYTRDHWAGWFRDPTPYYAIPLPRSPGLQRELEDLADAFHRRFCYRLGFLAREFRQSLAYPRMLALKARLACVLARETVLWRRKTPYSATVDLAGTLGLTGAGRC